MNTLRDYVLAQLILARLSEDKHTCGQAIEVSVVDNTVFLVGLCDSEEQKNTAAILAAGFGGIRIVVNRLRVRTIVQSI